MARTPANAVAAYQGVVSLHESRLSCAGLVLLLPAYNQHQGVSSPSGRAGVW